MTLAEGMQTEELISIADAVPFERVLAYSVLGVPVWPSHWRRMTLDDQLDAIRQLGMSNDSEALEYLRNLLFVDRTKYEAYSNIASFVVSYPHARGELYEALRHPSSTIRAKVDDWQYTQGAKSYDIICSAIRELEQTLSASTPA